MDLDLVFLGLRPRCRPRSARPRRSFCAGRRAAPLRLRGGHAATASALVGRASRHRGDLPYPTVHADHFRGLPGMLKTFALRGREDVGLTVYGPGGHSRSLLAAEAVPRPPAVSPHSGRARGGRDPRARRVRARSVRRRPRRARTRLRARRARPARPLRRLSRGCARRAAGPGARASSREASR